MSADLKKAARDQATKDCDSSLFPHEEVCLKIVIEFIGNSAFDARSKGFLDSMGTAMLDTGIMAIALTTKRFLCIRKPYLAPPFRHSVPWNDVDKLLFKDDYFLKLTTLRIMLKNKKWIDITVQAFGADELVRRIRKVGDTISDLLKMR